MYGLFPYRCLKGEVDFDAGPVRAALAGAYTFEVDTHDRFSQVVEASGQGYAPGGIVVQNQSMAYDPVLNQTVLLGDDLNFPTLTTDVVNGVVFYLDDAATRPLIAYHRIMGRAIENAPFTYHLTNRTIARIAV